MRGPLWFVSVILLGVASCSLAVSGALLAAHQNPPSFTQMTLSTWALACESGREQTTSLQPLAEGAPPYQASVPGLGRFLPGEEGHILGEITLGDVVLAAGQPQSGCLDYSLLHHQPVVWVRLAFADRHIEVYSAFSNSTGRLLPDTPIYILYCYPSGVHDSPNQSGSWQGFVPVAAYRDCARTGTVTP